MTTKELIAQSFLELSKTKRVDKITIKEIAANCSLTKATFYNYFYDKYDLIVWIYTEPVKDIFSQINKSNFNFRQALTANIKYFADNRHYLINALVNTSGQNSFLKATKKAIQIF